VGLFYYMQTSELKLGLEPTTLQSGSSLKMSTGHFIYARPGSRPSWITRKTHQTGGSFLFLNRSGSAAKNSIYILKLNLTSAKE